MPSQFRLVLVTQLHVRACQPLRSIWRIQIQLEYVDSGEYKLVPGSGGTDVEFCARGTHRPNQTVNDVQTSEAILAHEKQSIHVNT